jgi:transcriptional regulator with XRE-family HTH domain
VVRSKNRRVPLSPEERTRIGRDLQRRREALDLKQEDIATKADIGIGTVQNIEHNKVKVGLDNLERYAVAVGTSLVQLLHPEALQPLDDRWRDLHDEHLLVARQYMKARKVPRAAVELLLIDELAGPGMPTELAEVVIALHQDPKLLELWDDVMECLESEEHFERALQELIVRTKTK